jgi:hypothetical protein
MKRVNEYKKLFEVEGDIDLKTLKNTYRNLVKAWHPDKFQSDDEKAAEAERMSRQIIDGYHFLVSMAPETKEANLPKYLETLETCGIVDYKHKGLLFEITFTDGTSYEYFGVNRNAFLKFHNSDKQMRFGKRNIFHSYTYRRIKEVQGA